MAYDEEKPVGRIAGIINHKVNEKCGKKAPRFGFVDFIDNTEVSSALFNAVENGLVKREIWKRSVGVAVRLLQIVDPEGLLIGS